MSTGGLFQLISNDGKQDDILYARQILKDRLTKILATNTVPSIQDIEETHIIFTNTSYKPYVMVAMNYSKIASRGTSALGGTLVFDIPVFGDFISDIGFHVILSDPVPNDTSVCYRWSQYPGERLMEKVSFEVGGCVLDSYNYLDYVIYRKTELPQNKVCGYNRCVGQENASTAEIFQTTTTPAENCRISTLYFDGFQTPKTGAYAHGDLEMIIPLLFWFRDPRLAFPIGPVQLGHRQIKIDLCSQNLLVGVEQRGTNPTSQPPYLVQQVDIKLAELFVNNIFMDPTVVIIFIKKIIFQMVRVHRSQTVTIDSDQGEIKLNDFKWPIEYFYIGFRPIENFAPNSSSDFYAIGGPSNHFYDHWHYFSSVKRKNFTTALSGITDTQSETVKTLSLSASGISLYDFMPTMFYRDYMPMSFGEKINTLNDLGLYFFNFALYPGSYQPSGHINASRMRELYLNYISEGDGYIIQKANPVQVYASAKAINFLLIKDSSAVLRYST